MHLGEPRAGFGAPPHGGEERAELRAGGGDRLTAEVKLTGPGDAELLNLVTLDVASGLPLYRFGAGRSTRR